MAASRRPSPPGVDDVVRAFLTASRVLMGLAAASLAELEGTLTLAHFRLLVLLDDRGESTANELADALGVQRAAAARMLDRLAAQGLVEQFPGRRNGPAPSVALSRGGAELVWRVMDRRRAAITRVVRRMPPARRDELLAALAAFADAAGEPQTAALGAFLGW